MTKGCALPVCAKGDAFSASAKARASLRVLFIFQLVPIHGVFISCILTSQGLPNRTWIWVWPQSGCAPRAHPMFRSPLILQRNIEFC